MRRPLEGEGTDSFFDASSYGSVDVYTAWVASVKSIGGVPTVLPDDGLLVGLTGISPSWAINQKDVPAGRFSLEQVDALGLIKPDVISRDGRWLYFVAPQNVIDWVENNGIIATGLGGSQPAVDKGALDLTPDWAKNLSTAGKVVTVVAIGGAVMYALSWLPRPRARSG